MIKLTASVSLLLFVESCYFLLSAAPCDSKGSKSLLSFNTGSRNNNIQSSRVNSLYLQSIKPTDNLSIVRQQPIIDKKHRNFVDTNVQSLVSDNYHKPDSNFGPAVAPVKTRTRSSKSRSHTWRAPSRRYFSLIGTSRTSTTTARTIDYYDTIEVNEETNSDEAKNSSDSGASNRYESGDDTTSIQKATTMSKTVKSGTERSISDKSDEKNVKSVNNDYDYVEIGDEETESSKQELKSAKTTTSTPLITKKPVSVKLSSSSPSISREESSKSRKVNEKKGQKEEKESSPSKLISQQQLTETSTSRKRTNETSSIPIGNEDNQDNDNDYDNTNNDHESHEEQKQQKSSHSLSSMKTKKPLVSIPFIKPKNETICTPEAYLEFPRDLIGNKWRARGFIIIHIVVVCYMFYSLALVCERYFMPSLEEFAQRLQLSEDVAGATLMSAGSSAPELFTALLGVFIAKGDVGTGAIVGSAVFNILFVIGVCAFVSTTSAQLDWWPVLRDSVFYTFTVLILILFIYDERVTAFESFFMIFLYGLYILLMIHNEKVKDVVTRSLLAYPVTAKIVNAAVSIDGPDDVFSSASSSNQKSFFGIDQSNQRNYRTTSMTTLRQQSCKTTCVEDDSMFMAALLIIVQHKRLFKSQLRFQAAARYIIIKRQHKIQQKQSKKTTSTATNEVNYFGPESGLINNKGQKDRIEAYAANASLSKNKFSIVSKDDYEFWNRPPEEGENYYIWLAKIPVNYVLHYTCPDCTLYPDKYLFTFFISIAWTAFFSYIMVWMVTLIGFTLGIPDSVMGFTFLAAGTSIPDCYSSIHAARNGMANMAVSNSIGSNVFDILIGLSLPWFIQTAIYPGVVATINSRGVIYSVILLFLSLIVTIYLMNKYEWTLKPRLGLALLIAYGLFIVLTCMLEFNLFGYVNPPPC